MGPLHQLELSGDGVDGIHNIIILRKVELNRRLRQVKDGERPHHAIRIDIQNPLLRHIHLQFSHTGVGCQNLTIDVGDADGVAVNQIQLPHTAPGQSLYRIAAHAADAKDRNPGGSIGYYYGSR